MQTINWEKDIGKDNVDKASSLECLNKSCCAVSAKVYSDWFLLIASFGKLSTTFLLLLDNPPSSLQANW